MKEQQIVDFYKDIKDNLTVARKAFLATAFTGDEEGNLRDLDLATSILETLEIITITSYKLLDEYPSLDSLIEKEFGQLSALTDRESVVETCFVDDFLFPDTQNFSVESGQGDLRELLQSYRASYQDWIEEKRQGHINTQSLVKENFDTELKSNQLSCQCVQCLADFRGKLREKIFHELTSLIDEAEEELYELIMVKRVSDVSNHVQKLKQEIEKRLHKIRYKLKRGSLNKLDSDIKAHFKSKFGYDTQLGKVYKEKLMAFFNGLLAEKEIKPDLISEQEYERFFTQLNIGIWKQAGALRKEFDKLVRSILAFKRKDISATILRDYLGQFWVHSEARRKNRKIIYHMGPTNSGKTYSAIESLSLAKKGCYLAPLRLLASELYDTLSAKGVKTTLLTGEEVIEVEGATHYSSTIEMAKLHEEFDCVVIDEIQMITDTQRGWAWTRALVSVNSDEVHLCGDSSVFELVEQILKLTGDTLEVRNYERKTKLSVQPNTIKLVEMQKNDALIVFSRRNALKYKMDLENLGFKVSIVYGRLSPEVRREQARKFDIGETDVIVATDAISMGMNLPIKRIVFSTISKFINSKEYPITHSEIKQIAGRAGRYKRFPEGKVTCLQKVDGGLETVEEALACQLDQKEFAMVGPDLEIFKSVNDALKENDLSTLSLSEFLRLFNTMTFEKPFYCVDLKEMIELAETVEQADLTEKLSDAEVFGFACAPVNLGLVDHVQYYVWILNHYVGDNAIINEKIDALSDDIDYLETAIKCVELYQWLARHFDNKNFSFNEVDLLENKMQAIERLNGLLSEKISKKCSSCGAKLADSFRFNICEDCFGNRRQKRKFTSEGEESSGGHRRPRRGHHKKKTSSTGKGSGPAPFKPSKKKKSNKSASSAFKKTRR